jgi:hypothetical protein
MSATKLRQEPRRRRRRSDWTGAEVLAAGQRPEKRSGSMTFYVYRSTSDPDLFLVAGRADPESLPKPPKGGWRLFRILPETGKPRIGFSEASAKLDIAEHGFHAVRIEGSGTVVVPAGELVRRPRRARRA